jgi:hypothetical protein
MTTSPLPVRHEEPVARPATSGRIEWRTLAIAAAVWAALQVAVLVLARDGLPFDHLAGVSTVAHLGFAAAALVQVLVLMVVTRAVTRRRVVPDLAARAPERRTAVRETVALLGYLVAAQLLGLALGRAMGWSPLSFHLPGTLFGAESVVSRAEAIGWATYNLVVYAVIPYRYFRSRYTTTQLGLRSTDRRNDLLLILVVLWIEIASQLLGLSSAVLELSPREAIVGGLTSLVLNLVGTVLPTMIFIYCILVPRYQRIFGSTTTTVLLGGLTYAAVHTFESWTIYDAPATIVLSLALVLLQYVGPGMLKTYLTVRTGNAWVHAIAYHGIAPHVVIDTPLVVEVFDIR